MKCNELKAFDITVAEEYNYEDIVKYRRAVYNKSDVDAAIAELKEFAECACLERDDNQSAIDELQSENEQLKAKLESVQASAYADSVDAGMRERRLRRALYKACEMWADRTRLICSVFGSNAPKIRWERMYDKCLKKAEEYK